MQGDNSSAFDKLVAGLSSEDRINMLNNINKDLSPSVQFTETENSLQEQFGSITLKLKQEPFFYRLLLWVRSVFQKKSLETIYTDDILLNYERKIMKDHPGLIESRYKSLDSVFFSLLKSLKEASDFFKPYFSFVNENPGDFYVFLSSFVAPELSQNINAKADPFILPYTEEPTPSKKNELIKELDEILNDIDGVSKSNLYAAITSVSWLNQFTQLPFLHFTSQFTNISSSSYTCPYRAAQIDYDEFAAVFSNVSPVQTEVLEALYLFSQKKKITKNVQDKDIERAVKEFLSVANQHFGSIQLFISSVPVIRLGKIISKDLNWQAKNIEGVEAWFPLFRKQWHKIIEIRWADWVRERKKSLLESRLFRDFGLTSFPSMTYAPWQDLWTRVSFSYELTAGFINWFMTEKSDFAIEVLNSVMMEGFFLKNENKVEYSEAMALFSQAIQDMKELVKNLSPNGEIGTMFAEFSENRIRTFQVKNQIDAVIHDTENIVREIIKNFSKSCRMIERVLSGFFDLVKDGIHEGLQNFTTIHGHQNKEWRENLSETRNMLQNIMYYIGELTEIDETASL